MKNPLQSQVRTIGRLLRAPKAPAPDASPEAPQTVPPRASSTGVWGNSYFGLSEEACALIRQRVSSLPRRPKLSFVVPTYNTPDFLLRACILSVLDQGYDAIELIVVDDASPRIDVVAEARRIVGEDPRVKILERERNGGIAAATNHGIEAATGEFVLFLDHDDELMPTSALRFAEAIVASPAMDAWYSDQVKCDEQGSVIDHFHKPVWSPTYMLGVMYLGHLLGVRASVLRDLSFDTHFDGVQDFEFMLRLSERTQGIGHIPEVLYKWRAVAGSLAAGSAEKSGIDELQRRAVQAHLDRLGRSWRVRPLPGKPHRLMIKSGPKTRHPKVSIVIPSRNQGEMVERCLDSIFAMTDYPDYEVVLVDNKTTDPRARAAFARYPLKHVLYREAFNYSRANNQGVEVSDGELLLFLNNDTEVTSSDWLKDLALFFEDPGIGAVGPTLLYPDRTVQHAGVVLGARGTADHVMRHFHEQWDGYAGSLVCAREVSAVTAACLMMPRALFHRVGGFSEDFANHYQDVDLCLKIREEGRRIISAGYPRLIHYESATRKSAGYDLGDRAILIDRWNPALGSDPYYSKALDLGRLDYAIR